MRPRASGPLLAAIVSLSLMTTGTWANGDDNPAAHALAEKFAGAAEREEAKRKAADDARRAGEEAEMLDRARREAAERKAAADKARAAAEAEEARREQEKQAEARRLADEQRAAREAFIAEQIRAEEKRAEDERRLAEEKRREDERRQAEATRIADEQRRDAEKQKALEAERETQHRRLTERLLQRERELSEQRRKDDERRAEEARLAEEQTKADDAKRSTERAPMALGGPPPAERPPVSAAPPPSTRVTVLLVMDVGATGIRRFGRKTADPVLCAGPTCWVSAGPDKSSRAMARGQTLGPANTLGPRAAACNQHLTCVFRDIDLKTMAADIQPVDLRILRHDRREPKRLEADSSCRISHGALVCDRIFASRSWRAWVIPEHVAAAAGGRVLEAALAGGLAMTSAAALAVPHP